MIHTVEEEGTCFLCLQVVRDENNYLFERFEKENNNNNNPSLAKSDIITVD